jgi:hypothetical protein
MSDGQTASVSIGGFIGLAILLFAALVIYVGIRHELGMKAALADAWGRVVGIFIRKEQSAEDIITILRQAERENREVKVTCGDDKTRLTTPVLGFTKADDTQYFNAKGSEDQQQLIEISSIKTAKLGKKK